MKIIDVATHINPSLTSLDKLHQLYQWGDRNQKIFSRFHRLESACIFPHQSLAETLTSCLERLLAQHPDKLDAITHVAYAHSLHTTYPFDIRLLESIVRQQLSARVEVMSLTQGSCASSFMGLALLDKVCRVSPDGESQQPTYAILLTGDKCFHETIQYVDQNGLFGEGCTAVLVSSHPDTTGLKIQGLSWSMIGGISHRTVDTSREDENRYDRSFIPTMMDAIDKALVQAGISAGEIHSLLPYHMSPPTFDRLADRLGIERSQIYRKNLYRVGHCFCGDAFINLHDFWKEDNQQVSPGPMLAVAAGVAGTFSAMVLTA
ncbi:3-oxoacyl-[acyl-carrier-protein] synthase III C-terminal domain-containing protein [Vibrio mangrovi]|uniref:Beta-ketoacyl-[acyl-carrier-protein] synthase III C-terminal domain-containing protein n=1 Tax=Vibrio mangrovi TaxID=474394 RepID=A0A1Y6ISG0_9VIBR|nr:3-oxoacyl-[acyl-carrier-protein] synthase III C-terminal domain-containing protein [Vibrio mangrovi]MDW6001393.1 hypothetical protein [Vibrio mangrovi]SMS00585.1 hypothetical protein VIM7927_01851 [Vibrio mangrovi]